MTPTRLSVDSWNPLPPSTLRATNLLYYFHLAYSILVYLFTKSALGKWLSHHGSQRKLSSSHKLSQQKESFRALLRREPKRTDDYREPNKSFIKKCTKPFIGWTFNFLVGGVVVWRGERMLINAQNDDIAKGKIEFVRNQTMIPTVN